MAQRPLIGVGVIIRKGGKVLLGKRKNAHGAGMWCCPGGHLEFGKTVKECAERETTEEVGITITNIQPAPYTEDFFTAERAHYITIFVVCDYEAGEVTLREPDKCEGWGWFAWDSLPSPLCLPHANLLKKGYNPFMPLA